MIWLIFFLEKMYMELRYGARLRLGSGLANVYS